MDEREWIFGMIICVILLITVLKWNAKILGNFFLRGIIGMICIYGVNQLLAMYNLFSIIQCNPLTFLTTGILGFPGVFLLYGVEILNLLS